VKTWIKCLVAITAIAIILAFGAWRFFTWGNQRDAERFVTELRNLEVGKSTSADLSRLIKSTSRWASPIIDCSPDGKGNSVGIVTFGSLGLFRWLYRLRFPAGMGFRCTIYTENDRLHDQLCVMSPANMPAEFAFVQESVPKDDGSVGMCRSLLTSENKYFNISQIPTGFFGVCVTPQTPPELRDLAYKFDFNCFSRLRGCTTLEEMLPVLSRKKFY
jgi:hypothetical protein